MHIEANAHKKKITYEPPSTKPSNLCIADIRIDHSLSGCKEDTNFSISLSRSFSEKTFIGSTDFVIRSPSPAPNHDD
jgi:hypothetical protein